MYAVNYIDDKHIAKTEHKLFILRDESENRLATLSRQGAECLLTAFQMDLHIDGLDELSEGERQGCWLGDGVRIDGQLVTAFTLERQTWFCYSNA